MTATGPPRGARRAGAPARGRGRGHARRGRRAARRRAVARCSSSAPAPTPPARAPRWSRCRSGSTHRCGRRPSAPAPASRRTTRNYQGLLPAARGRLRERARRPRRRSWSSGRRSSGSTPTSPARSSTTDVPDRRGEPGPGRGAPQPGRPRRAHRPGGVLRRARRAGDRARAVGPSAAGRRPPCRRRRRASRCGRRTSTRCWPQRTDRDTVVVEETPSTRQVLEEMLPSREPLGYLGVAMGGLGFGMPAAIGVRMARPDRPVIAILGDGSSMYAVQSLWTAANYGVGALFIVFANGGYAIMDKLAERAGGKAPWPELPGGPALRAGHRPRLPGAADQQLRGAARGARRRPAAAARAWTPRCCSTSTSSPSRSSTPRPSRRGLRAATSRRRSRQNSLPSGSASTCQPSSPVWPTSARTAPRPAAARSSASWSRSVGVDVDVQPQLAGRRVGRPCPNTSVGAAPPKPCLGPISTLPSSSRPRAPGSPSTAAPQARPAPRGRGSRRRAR